MIMDFTTTTEIAKKGSKAFPKDDYKVVLNNNKNIGMLIWSRLSEALLKSRVLDDIMEDLEIEMNAEKLKAEMLESSSSWKSSLSI